PPARFPQRRRPAGPGRGPAAATGPAGGIAGRAALGAAGPSGTDAAEVLGPALGPGQAGAGVGDRSTRGSSRIVERRGESGTRGVQSRMNPARPDLSDPIPGPKQFPRPKLEGPPARAVPWLVVQGPRGLSQRGGADESAAALEPVQDGAGGGGVIGLQAGTHL